VDLIDRIDRALAAGGLNPVEFERCAVALLQAVYPGLSAVEGGHDFGRDGDIYFTIEGRGGRSRIGRLLATIGDPRKNARVGLSRMREESLTADVLVVATSHKLFATQRRSIEELATGYGVAEVQIFSRTWLVDHLFKEPTWRERLLPGVGGELRALATRPSSLLSQAVADGELVGRVEELRQLHALLDDGRDVVLVGPPGVGKTRICAELGEGVMFVESTHEGRLLDDLRELAPGVIVADDSDGQLAALKLLQRARQEEGAQFALIGITWPDRVERLRGAMVDAAVVELPLLARDEVDAIIQAQGVRGVRARHIVLGQAQGRPGWALILCAALLRGEAGEVLSGTALVQQVRAFVERSVGTSPKAMDALAYLGVLGYVNDSDCPRLAAAVGYAPAELARLLHHAATNGLVDRVYEGWAMAPVLGSPLVASWFFGNPPEGSWPALCGAFGDRTAELQKAALAAAETGAPAALLAADDWAHSLPEPGQWDPGTWSLVHDYAAFGRERSAWATKIANDVLSRPRSVESVLGVTIDLAGDAARRQLDLSVRSFLVPEAITGLLDLAVGDDRARHSNPDHPLRIIADAAQLYDPDRGTTLHARQAILHACLRWLSHAPTRERWIVSSEAAAAVFSPQISGSWTNPEDPMTVSLVRGIDSPTHLRELASLWTNDVTPVLTTTPIGQIPNTGLTHLLGLAEEWLRIGARRTLEKVNQSQVDAAAKGGAMILDSIRPHISAVPGLALRAQRVLDETASTDLASFEQDPQLLLLAGTRDIAAFDDVAAWQADREVKIAELALQLQQLGPDAAVRRYLELVEQIELTHFHDLPTALPNAIIEAADDPTNWAAAALKHGAVMILRSAILRMVKEPNAPELPADLMRAAVADLKVRSTAISHALFSPTPSPAVEIAIDSMTDSDSWMLDQAMLFHDQADEVVWRLLNHPVQVIRSTTAVYFAVGTSDGPPLPADWTDQWQTALLDAGGEDVGQYAQWRLAQLLQHLVDTDPDLAERWYSRRFSEMTYLSPPKPHGVEKHLSRLPRPHRKRLATLCAGRSWMGHSLLTYLIDSDATLAKHLLDEGAISVKDLCEALLGQRGETFEAIAPLAHERGADPYDLAAAAAVTVGWSRSELSDCEETLQYFKQLADSDRPALRKIAQAGIRQQKKRLQQLQQEHHHRRVRGE
jgi:hypothetical protein